jgi:hypothetical protein
VLETIVICVVLGVLVMLARWWRAGARDARSREQVAAILIHEEMTAAISSLDLALREDDARWLVSMSESATLTEVWREHGQALVGLEPERWGVLDGAVSAMTPRYALKSAGTEIEGQRRSSTARRSQLVEGAGILRGVLDERPRRKRLPQSAQISSLLG